MTDYSNTDAVIAYLNRHDVCGRRAADGTYIRQPTVVSERIDGMLVVRCAMTQRLATGEIELAEVHEAIEPTMRAARLWLGY